MCICGVDGADLEHFRTFVEAVFYVGKGKNSRSMQHLKDARDCTRRTPAKVSWQCVFACGLAMDCATTRFPTSSVRS